MCYKAMKHSYSVGPIFLLRIFSLRVKSKLSLVTTTTTERFLCLCVFCFVLQHRCQRCCFMDKYTGSLFQPKAEFDKPL